MNKASCDGVTLDVDSYDYGPETVTWGDAVNDPYSYNILVNDYDDEGDNWDNDDVEGLGPSGAKVTLFGETNIKMEAEAGNTGRQALQIFVKAQLQKGDRPFIALFLAFRHQPSPNDPGCHV